MSKLDKADPYFMPEVDLDEDTFPSGTRLLTLEDPEGVVTVVLKNGSTPLVVEGTLTFRTRDGEHAYPIRTLHSWHVHQVEVDSPWYQAPAAKTMTADPYPSAGTPGYGYPDLSR